MIYDVDNSCSRAAVAQSVFQTMQQSTRHLNKYKIQITNLSETTVPFNTIHNTRTRIHYDYFILLLLLLCLGMMQRFHGTWIFLMKKNWRLFWNMPFCVTMIRWGGSHFIQNLTFILKLSGGSRAWLCYGEWRRGWGGVGWLRSCLPSSLKRSAGNKGDNNRGMMSLQTVVLSETMRKWTDGRPKTHFNRSFRRFAARL